MKINPLKLGIVYDQNNNPINHRSLLKVLANPWLRLIGLEIGSIFKNDKIIGLKIIKCPKQKLKFSFFYDDTYAIIKKERMLW